MGTTVCHLYPVIFVNSGKPVFAICHGPQLLMQRRCDSGRKLTAVKPIIIDVKNAGAEFYDQEVVVDKDQLVYQPDTGRSASV